MASAPLESTGESAGAGLRSVSRASSPAAPRWLWHLPAPWVLALRYFRSTRREASVRFLSSMTSGGIGLGVAALVLAVAALSGFQRELLGQVLARTPELQIELGGGVDGESVERVVAGLGLGRHQELLVGRGFLSFESRLLPVEIVGYEDRPPVWFPGLALDEELVSAGESGIVIPFTVARRWALLGGETVELVSPRPQLSPVGRIPRNRFLPLAGTFDAGRSEEHERRIAVSLPVAERLLWPSDRRLDFELAGVDAATAKRRIEAVLPDGARVRTARDTNRALFFALRLEKTLMFLAVFLIVLVASQMLVSSLSLVIASKTREIGMLSTLGLDPPGVRSTFLLLGALFATVGVVAGGVLGCALALLLDRYELLSLPGNVYVVDYVPFALRPGSDLPVIFAATVLLTLLAAYSAGRKASVLEPVAALRR